MQYPIFVSVAEASRLLCLGKTSIFARISDGSLRAAKMGRSTRITFSSVIAYAVSCLNERDDAGAHCDIFRGRDDISSWTIAEHFARHLCNTHSEPNEDFGDITNKARSPEFHANEAGSPQKNLAGEF